MMNSRSFFSWFSPLCVFVRACSFPSTATSVSLLFNYASRPPFFVSLLSLALLCSTTPSHSLAGRICIYTTFLLTHLGLHLHPHLMPNVHTSCPANSVIECQAIIADHAPPTKRAQFPQQDQSRIFETRLFALTPRCSKH